MGKTFLMQAFFYIFLKKDINFTSHKKILLIIRGFFDLFEKSKTLFPLISIIKKSWNFFPLYFYRESSLLIPLGKDRLEQSDLFLKIILSRELFLALPAI